MKKRKMAGLRYCPSAAVPRAFRAPPPISLRRLQTALDTHRARVAPSRCRTITHALGLDRRRMEPLRSSQRNLRHLHDLQGRLHVKPRTGSERVDVSKRAHKAVEVGTGHSVQRRVKPMSKFLGA